MDLWCTQTPVRSKVVLGGMERDRREVARVGSREKLRFLEPVCCRGESIYIKRKRHLKKDLLFYKSFLLFSI